MAIIARFIGIDRYSDPQIRELSGARRDALAMHSLFVDSIPEVDSRLIVDQEATASTVRESLEATLGTATESDTVILYFGGHGSSNHRLVCHDSDVSTFTETSIGMDEIAESFKSSKAKVALCLLDCCFSGGAPARVLADVAIPRGKVDLLPDFVGEGRVLFTASSDDEPAWEDPKSRHGLFTKALLAALQTAEDGADLNSLLSDVMAVVRSEGAKMGVSQTPHLLGSIKGGIGLPRMRPGEASMAAFPEIHGAKVSADLRDLKVFGIPMTITQAWHEQMPSGLNELQLAAVNEKRILDGKSLLVVAPTSSGKTLIGEMAAARAATNGLKAVFLLPYKALANEKFDQFTALYGQHADLRVVRCTGDYSDQSAEILRGKYDIALLTYEMFLNLAVANPSVLNQLGLVVVDEAQFVTDPRRGIAVELLLTLLLTARRRGIEPQLVCLSAVIGDVNSFDAWLGCDRLVTTKRPVDLIEGVLSRDGVYKFKDGEGKISTEQLVPRHDIVQRRDKPSGQDVIVPLVRRLVAAGEQVIVFRNQRGKAQGCANYLADSLGLPPSIVALADISDGDPSTSSRVLRKCLSNGTAFHTSNLTREERSIVERTFRDPKGGIRAIGATTTVAAGINTPASTVIIAESEFLGEDGRPFTIAEYKNMAGRAGRLGYNEKGRAIIYAESAREAEGLFQTYVMGQPEPLRSSFDPQEIETWVLRLLAQVELVPAEHVPTLLANTYGGYLAARTNPSWPERAKGLVDRVIARMRELDLVEEESGNLSLTLIGKACARSALSFSSAMRLVELVTALEGSKLDPERLMILLQALPEVDGTYTPMMRRGSSETVRSEQASRRFGGEVIRLLQRRAKDNIEYLARCKRAAIIGDWIDGSAMEDVEKKYTPNPYQGGIAGGHVRGFADITRLYLRAAAEIAVLIHVESGLDANRLEALNRRLEFGVPTEALELISFAPFLDRGACMALIKAGISDHARIANAPQEELEGIVGLKLATRLARAKP